MPKRTSSWPEFAAQPGDVLLSIVPDDSMHHSVQIILAGRAELYQNSLKIGETSDGFAGGVYEIRVVLLSPRAERAELLVQRKSLCKDSSGFVLPPAPPSTPLIDLCVSYKE